MPQQTETEQKSMLGKRESSQKSDKLEKTVKNDPEASDKRKRIVRDEEVSTKPN